MKTECFLTILFLITLLYPQFTIYSQTIIPGGNVSGVWTAVGSPYQIQGDITVPAGDSLRIEPGVGVIFMSNYVFYVFGSLTAAGTATDSIYFLPADTAVGWKGITFRDYSTSNLEYCNLRYCKGSEPTIWLQNYANVTISHCSISDNTAVNGGGLWLWGSSKVTVLHSSIVRNTSNIDGGGIYLEYYSKAFISNSDISFNRSGVWNLPAVFGGGIYFNSFDSLIVQNCTFNNNMAATGYGAGRGGAISAERGYLDITGCTFLNNKADYYGGAISLNNCQAELTDNYFDGNRTGLQGAAVYVKNSNALIAHSIFIRHLNIIDPNSVEGVVFIGDTSQVILDHCNFYNNFSPGWTDVVLNISSSGSLVLKNSILSNHPYAGAIWFSNGSVASVMYNDFYSTGGFWGSVPSGLGVISGINANGDSCDIYKNIFLDPKFVDPLNGNFNLQEVSPCIDAGDPLSLPDPDSTIADIGCFYFDQVIPVELVLFSASVNKNKVILKWITSTETNNHGFDIQRKINNSSWEPVGFIKGCGTTVERSQYIFTDELNGIVSNQILYRLKQIDLNGSYNLSNEVLVEISAPADFNLEQNYPNPFNPSTKIKYYIPEILKVVIKVFDVLGNEIETLVNEEKQTGTYEITWPVDGLPSGVYFYRLKAGDFISTKKMVLIK